MRLAGGLNRNLLSIVYEKIYKSEIFRETLLM